MVKKNSKMMKVYEEDWETLNQYLSVLQIEKRERLSFADAIHEAVEKFIIPYMEKFFQEPMKGEQ